MLDDTPDQEQPSSELTTTPDGSADLNNGNRRILGSETPATNPGDQADEADSLGEIEREEVPLARVRYGLGKELRLYPDSITVLLREEHEELRYSLANIRRLVLAPGEHTPSKLVLMFELDDGNTVIAAEGVSNVRGFRKLLAQLEELHLPIELDPPNMDEQLRQALEIRTRYQMGCYGLFLSICLLLTIAYIVIAVIGAHHH